MQSLFFEVREYLAPILRDSKFKENGVLTPEEFVVAGDALVHHCPTWEWMSCDKSRQKDYLPVDKQYLVTKNVPCTSRANDIEQSVGKKEAMAEEEGDWLITEDIKTSGMADEDDIEEIGESGMIEGKNMSSSTDSTGCGGIKDDKVIGDVSDSLEASKIDESGGAGEMGEEGEGDSDEDEYLDMETFEEDNLLEGEDEGELIPTAVVESSCVGGDGKSMSASGGGSKETEDNIKLTRTYDISITYDKYYQTPRVFLFGYDEMGRPLKTKEIYEDIMADYVKRTVTMEKHPHRGGGELQAAIHPCRHAAVMKSIIAHLMAGGKVPVVDQYLFIFLKFIQSVVPTVNYDFTFSVAAR